MIRLPVVVRPSEDTWLNVSSFDALFSMTNRRRWEKAQKQPAKFEWRNIKNRFTVTYPLIYYLTTSTIIKREHFSGLVARKLEKLDCTGGLFWFKLEQNVIVSIKNCVHQFCYFVFCGYARMRRSHFLRKTVEVLSRVKSSSFGLKETFVLFSFILWGFEWWQIVWWQIVCHFYDNVLPNCACCAKNGNFSCAVSG